MVLIGLLERDHAGAGTIAVASAAAAAATIAAHAIPLMGARLRRFDGRRDGLRRPFINERAA